MSSYVRTVLQPGETVRYQGSVHWILYLTAILWALLGLVLIGIAPALPSFPNFNTRLMDIVGVVICFLIAASKFVRAWFKRWTTQIVVTDRRVLYIRGFIKRHTIEINMDKIESVDVDQTVLGRFLNFGDVQLHGTGTTWELLRDVDRPLALRNEITAR